MKTAEDIAATIPCQCSDCGMDEPAGAKMIQEFANQQLAEYKNKLRRAINEEVDWTTGELNKIIDSL